MSTLYAQHTVTSVFVGQTGHQHTKNTGAPPETPFALDCPACEPFLRREGWVVSPEQVPLTDRQISEKERIEREGNLAVKHAAQALSVAAGARLASGSGRRPRRKRLE